MAIKGYISSSANQSIEGNRFPHTRGANEHTFEGTKGKFTVLLDLMLS